MDIRVILGQLIERTEAHTEQIQEIRLDAKATRAMIEALARRGLIAFWMLAGLILNYDPKKIAELLLSLKGLH